MDSRERTINWTAIESSGLQPRVQLASAGLLSVWITDML